MHIDNSMLSASLRSRDFRCCARLVVPVKSFGRFNFTGNGVYQELLALPVQFSLRDFRSVESARFISPQYRIYLGSILSACRKLI
jgi:hypothetical protein